jgi:hypothetical protein
MALEAVSVRTLGNRLPWCNASVPFSQTASGIDFRRLSTVIAYRLNSNPLMQPRVNAVVDLLTFTDSDVLASFLV